MQKKNKQTRKQTTKGEKMKRYQLFSEFNDAILWGKDLTDALSRQKKVRRHGKFKDNKYTAGEIVTIKSIVGARDTTGSTRGQWKYESVVCETTEGQLIKIDARIIGQLV